MAKRIGESGNRMVPEFATKQSGATAPFCDPSPAFVLVFNPRRWCVLGGKLIPSLHKMALEAGVNRVDVGRDGRILFADARARIEEKGRTLVPFEWGPEGSYLQAVECRPRGGKNTATAHMTVWERAALGDTETYTDEAAYAEWVAGLVESGKLPACPAYLARRMLEKTLTKLREAQARAERGGVGSGAARLRVEALQAEVDVLREAAETKGQPVKGEATTPELGV